jgi:phospholipid-transporting ATPase
MLLALCHSITVEEDNDEKLVYNSASPDELALVNFAKFSGWEYKGID